MAREHAFPPARPGLSAQALHRAETWAATCAGRSVGLGWRPLRVVLTLAWLGGLAWSSPAAAQVGVVVRCPGPPVLYTDALSAEEARSRGCRTIEGAPITVVQVPRARPPAPAGAGPAPGASGAPAARPADTRVDATAQRQRDTDARRILEAELRREEDKLAGLRREFNNGEPERRGEERNYQTYLDRVAQMRAAIARTESDIASIKREIGKLN